MSPALTQHDVFVSYSRKDIAFAKILHEAMKERGLDTWIDWEDIPPSADWLAEVYLAIESAHTFVFVVSQASVDSEVCRLEIDHATKHNKRVVPITVHDIDAGSVPNEVSSLNWIFFRQEDDFQRSFDMLLEAIRTDLDWVRAHTRLLQRALEWESQDKDASFLIRGSELAATLEAIAEAGTGKEPRLTALQAQFVQESRRHEAEQERKWRRRSQLIRGLISGALVISVVLTLWALANEREARFQQKQSRSNELASLARMTAEQDPALSFRLARAAIDAYPGLMAQSALWAPLRDPFTTLLLTGHRDRATTAVYSPDERLIATSSWDGTVRLWDASTGEHLRTLDSPDGHEVRTINSLTFTPDGRQLVSMTQHAGLAGGDIACVWDVSTGQLAYTLAHDDSNGEPAVSPTGEHLVVLPPLEQWKPGRYDVPVFDPRTGDQVLSLEGHTDGVRRAVFSADGRFLATDSTEEGITMIWDMELGKQTHILGEQSGYSRELAWSPDSRMLIITSSSGYVRFYDTDSGELAHEHVVGTEAGLAVFSPDGDYLAVKTVPDRVLVFDAGSREVVREFRKVTEIGATLDNTHDIAFTPGGAGLAFAVDAGRVEIRDIQSGELAYTLKGHVLPVTSISFTSDGNSALTSSEDGTARVWALEAGQEIERIEPGDGVDAQQVGFSLSKDGGIAVLRIGDSGCQLWDLRTLKMLWEETGEPDSVTGAAISPDGSRMLTASSSGAIMVRNARSGDVVCQVEGHGRALAVARFSPKGDTIATVAHDQAAIIWDARTGERLLTYEHRPDGDAADIAFSPDGSLVVTAIGERAHVWEAATGKPILKLMHDKEIRSALFTPDGAHIITSDILGANITVWDVASGERVWRSSGSRLLGVSGDGGLIITTEADKRVRIRSVESSESISEFTPPAEPISARLSPDGDRLVAGCMNGAVRVWDVMSGDAVVTHSGHTGSVWGVAFIGDTDRIASWSMDGSLRVWPTSLEEMLRLLDQGFRAEPRALSSEEMREYHLESE